MFDTIINGLKSMLWAVALVFVFTLQLQAELRDPTRPSGFQVDVSDAGSLPEASDEIRLQAIFYHPVKPSAMINGRTYVVGDAIADARIVSIKSDSVFLQTNAQNKELKLSTAPVKTKRGKAAPVKTITGAQQRRASKGED